MTQLINPSWELLLSFFDKHGTFQHSISMHVVISLYCEKNPLNCIYWTHLGSDLNTFFTSQKT